MLFNKFATLNNQTSTDLMASNLEYAKLILPTEPGQIMVTAKYDPCILGDTCFITLNQNLETVECTDYEGFYYGASPNLNCSSVLEAISKLKFTTAEGLSKFIADHAQHFMLHKGQEEYLPSIAKYIVLAISYKYGIILRFTDSIPEPIADEANKCKKYFAIEGLTLTIRGCPTAGLLDLLDGYHFIPEEQNSFTVSSDPTSGMDIRSIYSDIRNIDLLQDTSFYSGVLLKALHLEERNIHYSNSDISSICVYYERSTYATVLAMDNNFINHPLLTQDDRNRIIRFFEEDDRVKRKHLAQDVTDGAEGRTRFMERVNQYLQHSGNVNQIGITGNIITSDGKLICAVRNSYTTDSGFIYPSANGNAEIADTDVEYYRDSVDVDYPTIHIDRETNCFTTELCRETEAELNLSLSNNLWKCRGITISGHIPSEVSEKNQAENDASRKEYPSTRRMHLNILYTQSTDKSFKDVKTLQASSVERFENRNLIGVSTHVFQNHWEKFLGTIMECLRFINKNRALITQILLLISVFDPNEDPLKTWYGWVKLVLAVVLIIISTANLHKTIKSIKERIQTECSVVIVLKSRKTVEQQMDKALRRIHRTARRHHGQKKGFQPVSCIISAFRRLFRMSKKENLKGQQAYHPVAYMAVKLHLLDSIAKAQKERKKEKHHSIKKD